MKTVSRKLIFAFFVFVAIIFSFAFVKAQTSDSNTADVSNTAGPITPTPAEPVLIEILDEEIHEDTGIIGVSTSTDSIPISVSTSTSNTENMASALDSISQTITPIDSNGTAVNLSTSSDVVADISTSISIEVSTSTDIEVISTTTITVTEEIILASTTEATSTEATTTDLIEITTEPLEYVQPPILGLNLFNFDGVEVGFATSSKKTKFYVNQNNENSQVLEVEHVLNSVDFISNGGNIFWVDGVSKNIWRLNPSNCSVESVSIDQTGKAEMILNNSDGSISNMYYTGGKVIFN